MNTPLSSTNTIKRQLFESFKKKEVRDLFVSQHLSTNIAAQIYSLREKKGWTQTQLAQKSEMAQGRISLLEDPNYQKYNIETLKRLASSFDVALVVRFVAFSDLADWVANLTPDQLAVLDFEDDSVSDLEFGQTGTEVEGSSVRVVFAASPSPLLTVAARQEVIPFFPGLPETNFLRQVVNQRMSRPISETGNTSQVLQKQAEERANQLKKEKAKLETFA